MSQISILIVLGPVTAFIFCFLDIKVFFFYACTIPVETKLSGRTGAMLTCNLVQLVVKSQILAGGRGLGTFTSGLKGGVHIVEADRVPDIAGIGDCLIFHSLKYDLTFLVSRLSCLFCNLVSAKICLCLFVFL